MALPWRVSCPHASLTLHHVVSVIRVPGQLGSLSGVNNVISWEGLQDLWSWQEVFLPIPDLPAAPWEQAVSPETLALSQGEIGWDHCP